jgi:cell wall-associated NlpC family hydrolase
MITAEQFCEEANGKPWVNRAEGNGSYDCWGLVLDSFRKIDGIELPKLTGYGDKKCSTSDAAKQMDMSRFTPSQPTNGAIMGIFKNNGELQHVGRVLCGRVLHATKGLGVRWDTYQSINSRNNNVRYFKYD